MELNSSVIFTAYSIVSIRLLKNLLGWCYEKNLVKQTSEGTRELQLISWLILSSAAPFFLFLFLFLSAWPETSTKDINSHSDVLILFKWYSCASLKIHSVDPPANLMRKLWRGNFNSNNKLPVISMNRLMLLFFFDVHFPPYLIFSFLNKIKVF